MVNLSLYNYIEHSYINASIKFNDGSIGGHQKHVCREHNNNQIKIAKEGEKKSHNFYAASNVS